MRSLRITTIALLLASAVGCGQNSSSTGDETGGSTTTAHGGASTAGGSSGASNGGTPGSGGQGQSGSSNAVTGGTTSSGGAANSGGTTQNAGGAAAGAATHGGSTSMGGATAGGSALGGTTASGGTNGGASASGGKNVGGADLSDAKPITMAGLTTAVELAPVRLAATGIYPAKITVNSGGVDALFGSNAPLVATNAETQALRVSVQHSNLRVIFTVCEGLYRLIGKKSAGISMLSDLKGKRVMVPTGTSSEYYLYKMLQFANLTESDVTIVSGSPGMGMLNADAATIWEPGIQYVSNTLKDDAVEFYQKDAQGHEVYRELFNLHATAESLADATSRKTIVQFVRALIDASAQITQDPSVVVASLTGPTSEGQADLLKSLKYERFAGVLVSDVLDVMTDEEGWQAKANNRTARSRSDLAKLIDDTVVKDALAL